MRIRYYTTVSLYIAAALMLILSLTACGTPMADLPIISDLLSPYETPKIDVQERTPDQIRAYAKEVGLTANIGVTYSAEPSLDPPYNPGSVSAKTNDAFMAALNTMRYIAGLEPVIWSENTVQKAQAAALVMTLNGVISHDPGKPPNISEQLYDEAVEACASSNLLQGFGDKLLSPLDAVLCWMDDSDKKNIAILGHRRACLNPNMAEASYGSIVTPGGTISVMSTADSNNIFKQNNCVPWPAQKMPVELYADGQAWSLTVPFPPAENSEISATIKNQKNGEVWTLSQNDGSVSIDPNISWGGACIILTPDGIVPKPGDTYDVVISAFDEPISYTVSFFSLGMNLSGEPKFELVDGATLPPSPLYGCKWNYVDNEAVLSWDPAAGADGYEIRRSYDGSEFGDPEYINDTKYPFTVGDINDPVYFKISSYKGEGNSRVYTRPLPVAINADINDIAPENLIGTPALRSTSIDGLQVVSWDPVYRATGYEVGISSDKNTYTVVQKSPAASFMAESVAPGTYYVRVRAYGEYGAAVGYGEYSDPLSITVVDTSE